MVWSNPDHVYKLEDEAHKVIILVLVNDEVILSPDLSEVKWAKQS